MDYSLKNQAISESIKATKARRELLQLKVVKLKLDRDKISKSRVKYFNRLFDEAKWLYNNILAADGIFDYSLLNNKVIVYDKDHNSRIEYLTFLSVQMRQAIVDMMKQSVYNLAKAKEKGIEVGPLGFKSYINCIHLKQYNQTYKIKDGKLRMQNCPFKFRILGTDQLKDVVEYSDAKFIRKGQDYYLHVTCYFQPEPKVLTGKSIGIDFGIESALTTSDGEKITTTFPESKTLKCLQKKCSRQVKHSKNYIKTCIEIKQEYGRITAQKKDFIHQLVHRLTHQYDRIYIQDEMVTRWKESWFGKQVQHGIIGGTISVLKEHAETLEIAKNHPTTQLCEMCGTMNKIDLKDRMYRCKNCHHEEDRDVHAAKNIKLIGVGQDLANAA